MQAQLRALSMAAQHDGSCNEAKVVEGPALLRLCPRIVHCKSGSQLAGAPPSCPALRLPLRRPKAQSAPAQLIVGSEAPGLCKERWPWPCGSWQRGAACSAPIALRLPSMTSCERYRDWRGEAAGQPGGTGRLGTRRQRSPRAVRRLRRRRLSLASAPCYLCTACRSQLWTCWGAGML
jgi:hypothetical protein